jgi:hypothetical protein
VISNLKGPGRRYHGAETSVRPKQQVSGILVQTIPKTKHPGGHSTVTSGEENSRLCNYITKCFVESYCKDININLYST